jgi:hypothetical protein
MRESALHLGYALTARLDGDSAVLNATLVLDSVTEYSGNAALAADAGRAAGATFAGRLTPEGKLAEFRGDSSLQFVRELTDELEHFFPDLPAGGAEPGVRWADTTEQRSTSSGVPLTIRSIAEHQIGDPEARDGEAVLPIRTNATYTFAGTGTQGGQAFNVEGKGHKATVEWLSRSGRYLGLVTSDSSSFTITLVVTGLQILGRQTRADTVSLAR